MSKGLSKQVLSSPRTGRRSWCNYVTMIHTLCSLYKLRDIHSHWLDPSPWWHLLIFRRVSSWWRQGEGRVCPRTSPSTNSSTTPCCWSWLARMSCWITPCEASQFSFFSLEHFRSNHRFTVPELYIIIVCFLYLVINESNPMFLSEFFTWRSPKMEAVPRLPMVEFELKSR